MKIQRKITYDKDALTFELEECTANPFGHCFICGGYRSKYHWRLDATRLNCNPPEILEMNYELPEYDAFDSVYKNVIPFKEEHLET